MTSEADRTPALSIVVPMLNEEEGVKPLLDALEQAFADFPGGWEVIAVDDGSSDDTWKVISCEARRRTPLRGMRLKRNFGQHAASIAGLEAARGSMVALMDADAQVDTWEMRRLVERVADGADLAFAARDHTAEGFLKGRLGAWIARVSCRSCAARPKLPPSTFLAARRDVVKSALSFKRRRPVISYHMLLGGARRIEWTHPQNHRRVAGATKYGAWRLFKIALDVFFGYTDLPFKVLTGMAIGAPLGAFLAGAGWMWLAASGSVAGGVALAIGGVLVAACLVGAGFIAARAAMDARDTGALYLVGETL